MTETLLPLWTIILGWMVAGGSPGPATLAISGTAMAEGRLAGLRLAAGVVMGSAIWGVAAGLGLSALMLRHGWLMEGVRVVGALYLLWLAIKSLRAAWRGQSVVMRPARASQVFRKGLLLHLTNPKAILAWGAIYAIALVPDAPPGAIWGLFTSLILASMVVFFGYALFFAAPPIARAYAASKRVFDLTFGLLFGAASIKLLTTRLTP